MMASKNSSREPSRAMWAMSRGKRRVPSSTMAAMNAAAFRAAKPRAGRPEAGSLSWGRITIRGTTARSWMMSIPIITLLDSVPSQPWLIRVLSRTMVLDSEIRAPSHSACCHDQPSAVPMP